MRSPHLSTAIRTGLIAALFLASAAVLLRPDDTGRRACEAIHSPVYCNHILRG
jgi:hypothetical protein